MIYIAIVMGMAVSLIFMIMGVTDPIASQFYFDVIGYIIAIVLLIGMLLRMKKSGSWNYFDNPKKNKPLLEFLYRDGGKRPINGVRIPGTGFFQVKGLGIIQDVGRLPEPGSVYVHGDKPIRFVLQDINHTPNPKFTGFYRFLTKMGFNRMEEVQDVINGYNPELMAKVWNRIVDHVPQTAADIIVENIKTLTPKEMQQIENIEKETIYDKVDNILRRGT